MTDCELLQGAVGRVLTPELADKVWAAAMREAAVHLERLVTGVSLDLSKNHARQLSPWYTANLASLELLQPVLEPLGREHFAEVETPMDLEVHYEPNFPDWIRRQKAGNLVALFLFFKGEPVGYQLVTVGKSRIHGQLVAADDVFFIQRAHRKGMLGLQFMRYTCDVLKDLGVHSFSSGHRMSKDLSVLFKRLGFLQTSQFYSKVL